MNNDNERNEIIKNYYISEYADNWMSKKILES